MSSWGQGPYDGIRAPIIRDTKEILLSPHVQTKERPCEHLPRMQPSANQKESPHREPDSQYLDLRCSRTVRNNFLLSKTLILWYYIMEAWADDSRVCLKIDPLKFWHVLPLNYGERHVKRIIFPFPPNFNYFDYSNPSLKSRKVIQPLW